MNKYFKQNSAEKTRIKSVLLIFVFAVIVSIFPADATASDRSFYFPRVVIEAEIRPDGSMKIVEERTFRFNGRYTGAWSYIYLKDNQNIRDVLVSETGKPYEKKAIGTEGPPGIYYVDYKHDQVYIDWSFLAINETRTFTISYIVDNAVLVHNDVAELYWQFIGDEWGERTNYASVTLTLPGGAEPGDIRGWGHGPLSGEVTIVSPTTVTWKVENLPARTYLEGRVAFPPELVNQADNLSGVEGLPGILADEEKWARDADRKRVMGIVDIGLALLITVGSLVYAALIYRREKKAPEAFQGDYYRELPGDYSPAEAGYLVRSKMIAPEDFTATLMDLARRGHLSLEEYEDKKGWLIKSNYTGYRVIPSEGKDPLKEHEQALYTFIFETVGKNSLTGTTLLEIQNYGKENSMVTASFYRKWKESIKSLSEQHEFFLETFWSGIYAGLALLPIGMLLYIAGMGISAVATICVGIVVTAAFATMIRHTAKGADHYAKWQAFKKFLQHFSNLNKSSIPALAIWEHYLVYAVSLGVAKQVMDQLHLVYPELRSDPHLLSHAYGRMHLNPSSFNSFNTTLTQTFSSGSGGGGGFSGGGGSGGGGGGGGAR